MNLRCDIPSNLSFPLQRVNARLTTATEMTYCKIQVNYHRFFHPWSDVRFTKTLKRLLLIPFNCLTFFLFLLSLSFPVFFFSNSHFRSAGSCSSDFSSDFPGFTFTFRSPDEVFKDFFGGQDPFASFFGMKHMHKQ